MGLKFDLSVYDKLANQMKMPKVATMKTTQITQLPDDFEPDNTEFNNIGEEEIGGVVP